MTGDGGFAGGRLATCPGDFGEILGAQIRRARVRDDGENQLVVLQLPRIDANVLGAERVVEKRDAISRNGERADATPRLGWIEHAIDTLVQIQLPQPALGFVIRTAAARDRRAFVLELDVDAVQHGGCRRG